MEINSSLVIYPQPQKKPAAVDPARTDPKGVQDPNGVQDPVTTVNLRDISVAEINHLITSGYSDLLDYAPVIPPQVIADAKNDPQIISNYRVDYLGQLETARAFKHSIGEDTSALDLLLEKLSRIHGIPLPEKVDTRV